MTMDARKQRVLQAVSYTHLDVYKRQVKYSSGAMPVLSRLQRPLPVASSFLPGFGLRSSTCLLYTSGEIGIGHQAGVLPDVVCHAGLLQQFIHQRKMCIRDSLYFVGETLDCAGSCGGFNLHWAFGSGLVAGRSCLRSPAFRPQSKGPDSP